MGKQWTIIRQNRLDNQEQRSGVRIPFLKVSEFHSNHSQPLHDGNLEYLRSVSSVDNSLLIYYMNII